jgi:hypothetical protein
MIEVLDAKPTKDKYYLCFGGADDPEVAVSKFATRFGHVPEQVLRYGSSLWLGPVVTITSERYANFD